VKNLLTGFVCPCLLVLAGNLPGRAQEKKPDPQPVDQAVPVSAAATGAPAATDPSQPPAAPTAETAPDQAAPPAAPQQTPPAAQTPPTGQTPVPPPTEEQPTQRSVLAQPPPPPPKVPDVRRPGESGFWVGVEGWFPKQQPEFNGGTKWPVVSGSTTLITMQGKPKYAATVEAGMAVGLHNTLKFVFTDFRANGDYTTPVEVTAWSQTYSGGEYVSTGYHVQNYKLSYEYLTWPYPVGSRKVRLKTLWQAQFTNVSSTFDAPLNYYDSNGNPVLNSAGQLVDLVGAGTKRIISPELGLGLSYYPSRHVRIEFEGSGFGFPHHYTIWDGDLALSYRVMNHFEIRAGGRGFGFKTSTNGDFYLKGNYYSGFVGIRWYSNSE
jgi:hypothetical protein